MALSRTEVEHVAALARLGLSDVEIATLQGQLSSILDHIAVLARLDTTAVLPTAQVTSLTNVVRDDIERPSLDRPLLLRNAPRQEDGFFAVRAVLGGTDAEES